MASPFKIFRKHQKVMIATLAILAMGAFVFLPPLMRILGGGSRGRGQPRNPVVVQWDGGKLRASDLDRMVLTRRIVNRFVQIASQMGAEASGTTPQPHPGFGPATQQDVVRTMLFARAAEDAGFVISDAAINHYIKQLTRNSVGPARLRRIIQGRYINGQPVTIDTLFSALRTELLAQQYLSSYLIAADSVTPLERWITWRRINERVSVELVPLPVEQFLDKVPDPAEQELRALYDQYKDVIKRPVVVDGTLMDSPDPGFKEPRRITMELVRADYDAVVDSIKPTITDEEIEKYYNENKRNFVQPSLLEEDAAQGEEAAQQPGTPGHPQQEKKPADNGPASEKEAAAKSSEEKPAGQKPAEEKPAEKKPAEEKPAEEKPAEEKPGGEKPAEEKPAEEKPAEEKPAEEKPAEEKPAGEKPAEEKAAVQGGSASGSAIRSRWSGSRGMARRSDRAGLFHFAALTSDGQADDGPPGAARSAEQPQASPAASSSDAASASDAADGSTGAETEPAGGTSAPGGPAAAETEGTAGAVAPGAPKANPPAAAQSGTSNDQQQTAASPSADAEPKYAPLDQVRDQIRLELARQRAPKKMDEALKPLRALIRQYHDDLMVWEVEEEERKEGDPPRPRPTPPDAKAWAAEHGMTYQKTAPVSFFEFNRMDVGRSVVRADGQPLAAQAFTILDVYQPVETEDFQGNRYLAWKIAESPERVPAFEEIRDKVAIAWKTAKARTLATKAAEALAEKAQAEKRPLADIFKDDPAHEVIQSDPFSWYTLGAVPGGRNVRFRISEVYGVDGAGPDFMRTVFSLEPGDVAVTTNHAKTVVYLVRLASKEESAEDLRARFLKEAHLLEPMVRRQNQFEVVSSLFQDLRERMHLKGWESLDTQQDRS